VGASTRANGCGVRSVMSSGSCVIFFTVTGCVYSPRFIVNPGGYFSTMGAHQERGWFVRRPSVLKADFLNGELKQRVAEDGGDLRLIDHAGSAVDLRPTHEFLRHLHSPSAIDERTQRMTKMNR
jgi:hypothetical protein